MAQSVRPFTSVPARNKSAQLAVGGRNALHLNRLQLRSGRIHAQQDDAANTSRDQRPQDGSKRAPKPRYIPEWNSVDIAEGEALEAALADAEAAVQPAAAGVANQIREQLKPEADQIATQLEASDSPGFSSPLPRPPQESSPAAANTTSQQATATRSSANATQPTSKHPLPHDDPQPRTQHKTPTPSSTAPTRDNAPPAVARDSTPTPASEPVFPALGVNPRPPSASASSSSQSPFFPSLGRASAGLPSSASLDFSTPAQPGPTPDPPSPSARQDSSASSSASAAATAGSVSSAAMRFRSLAQTTRNDQPAYRPRSALSLARRRMIGKYLPFSWQRQLRRRAENIPEQQFTYLLSTIVIVGTAAASGAAAYTLWPYARTVINFIFSADAVEARVLQELTFETQYLAAISLVTAILFGNTFAFSFDRQRQIIQEIAEEIFALELLLQELFIEIPEPHLRWRVIKHIKRYVEDEIQARDIDSPFRVGGAIMGLFDALLTLKEEGKTISKLLLSVEMLAQANSRRGALAAALLPPLHWVMLSSLCVLLLSAFVLFDSDFSNPVAENRAIFAVLSAMLVTIVQVLRDISTPDDGLYSVRDPMETRLSYVRWQMDNILSDPTIKVSMLSKEETEPSSDDEDDDDNLPQPLWMKDRS